MKGCDYQTDQGPGSLRMHMIINADPKCTGRYCKEHEAYVAANPETISQEWVRYLAKFPSVLHLDAGVTNVKE